MTQQELPTKESNALVKVGEGKTSAVDIQAERVVLSLAVPLRNGAWENYPKTYSVWKQRTPDLYTKAQMLKEGHEVWVQWTEKPAERGVYRDVVAMGRKRTEGETPSTPAPTEQSSGEMWDAMGPATTAKPPTPPAQASRPNVVGLDRDLAIMAQVSLKEAWETVRDLLRTEKVAYDNPLALHRLLADYTMMGMAVMREAITIQRTP